MELINPERSEELFATLANWSDELASWSIEYLLDWTILWQAVRAGGVGGSHLLSRTAPAPAVPTVDRAAETRVRARRLAESVLSQLSAIIFLLPVWLAIGLLVQLDAASHNDLLEVVASLMSAWVLIKLSSSFIANRLAANLLFVIAWSVAALNILGLLDAMIGTLDAVAIPLGTTRLTLLTILNSALLFVALLWAALAISRLLQETRFRTVRISAPRRKYCWARRCASR